MRFFSRVAIALLLLTILTAIVLFAFGPPKYWGSAERSIKTGETPIQQSVDEGVSGTTSPEERADESRDTQ